MFYLKETSYTFDINEYNFIKSIPADENEYTNDFYDISMEDYISKALPYFKDSHEGKNLKEGYVPETFFLLINDDRIIGQVRIRHYLTKELAETSGHIGYYIAPEFRGKGFGKNCLRLAITYAYQFVKEDEIYLRALKTNTASIKVQLANGGKIHHEDEKHTYVRIIKQPVSHEFAMQIALDEAYNGIGNGDGGPFGSVITKGNRIIGRGHNRVLKKGDPTCHGEMEAIRDACRNLKTHDLTGCELYTTAEPCPMCLGGILWSNISKVYYGCTVDDTNEIGFRDGKFYDFLKGDKNLLDLENFHRNDCLSLFKEYEKRKHLY